jgi:L-asparaginase
MFCASLAMPPEQYKSPQITYFSLGGTIASVKKRGRTGASPVLTAAELLQSIPMAAQHASIDSVQFMQVPSTEITISDLVRLHEAICVAVSRGSQGIVVSQGTDTLEESAFLLDLLWDGHEPIVFTGAIRNPSLPGNDGPANMQAAIQVALCEQARSCGVLIVINDEIHAARFVRKTHSSNPATFRSPVVGPIGWITEGRPFIATRPTVRPHFTPPSAVQIPPVALLTMGLGDNGILLDAVARLGYKGLVLEAFGGGHMRAAALPILTELMSAIPIILTTRTGAGEVLRNTYDFPGSEIDLLKRGLIHGGYLDGLKARLVLSLCLAHSMDSVQIAGMFKAFASS